MSEIGQQIISSLKEFGEALESGEPLANFKVTRVGKPLMDEATKVIAGLENHDNNCFSGGTGSLWDAINFIESLTTRAKELDDEVEGLKAKNAEIEESWASIDHFNNWVDNQLSESLTKIGEFPGKPAGMPDRVDVACRLIESIPRLKAEIERLTSKDKETARG